MTEMLSREITPQPTGDESLVPDSLHTLYQEVSVGKLPGDRQRLATLTSYIFEIYKEDEIDELLAIDEPERTIAMNALGNQIRRMQYQDLQDQQAQRHKRRQEGTSE